MYVNAIPVRLQCKNEKRVCGDTTGEKLQKQSIKTSTPPAINGQCIDRRLIADRIGKWPSTRLTTHYKPTDDDE